MTQADRNRLEALKKAMSKKMTQRQVADELKRSERQIRRLIRGLRKEGDKAIVHGLRGRSNRKIEDEVRQKVINQDPQPGGVPRIRADAGK